MDTEVSFTSPSASAEIITQAIESTKDSAPLKPGHDLPEEPGDLDGRPEPENALSRQALTTGENLDGIKTKAGRVKRSKASTRKVRATGPSSLASDDAVPDVSAARQQSQDVAQQPNCADPTAAVELQEETELTGEISRLWSSQLKKDTSIRRTRQELVQLRLDLGRYLAEYKKLTARTGRGGKWNSVLRKEDFPRTSANRFVRTWERSLLPEAEKVPGGSVSPETPEEIIAALIRKLTPRIIRALKTPDCFSQFLTELTGALQGVGPVG
jgi:hypothetical protein